MRALVTGATGFIGANVARDLLERGTQVRALTRSASDPGNLDGLDVERVEGDLRDPASLRRAMDGCEVVFHVAALYSFWVRPRRLIYEVNVDGTRNLFEAALAAGIERAVYTSSVATLRPREDGTPSDESDEAQLEDVIGDYKRSKLLAERVAREYSRRLPITIVLPSFPVGPWDAKPTPTGRTIVDFLNRRLPAYLDTGMNIVDVRDVARGHWLALEEGRPGERYILGGENVTMRRMLELLGEIADLPAPRIRLPYAPLLGLSYLNAAVCRVIPGTKPRMTPDTIRMSGHPMHFDPTKAVRTLGFPQTPPREALASAVAWFRDHGYAPTPESG